MIFRQRFLDGIKAGKVKVAFRRWTRPTVKAGGTLLTPVGRLAITAVEEINDRDLTPAAAKAAGFADVAELRADLRPEGTLYRIRFKLAGADPRIALREKSNLSADEIADLKARLARLDKTHGPWTKAVLRLIDHRPAVRAGDLAPTVGQQTLAFKVNVRKLKKLGLTESLGTGYRLSPRGKALLAHL